MFNIVDVIVILVIAVSVFLGYKKGFVKTVISLVSFFVAIGLALIFYKPFAVILTENTTIDDWIIEHVALNYEEKTEENKENVLASENSDIDEKEQIETNINEEKEDNEQEKLNILDFLPENMLSNSDFEEIKEQTKLEIAYKVSELIMNLLSLIIIYIVVKVTLVIASYVLNGIMRIPVLKQLNEILGMIIGAVLGFIQIYVAFAVLIFISSITDISVVIDTIKLSAFASVLFENNLIINLLF